MDKSRFAFRKGQNSKITLNKDKGFELSAMWLDLVYRVTFYGLFQCSDMVFNHLDGSGRCNLLSGKVACCFVIGLCLDVTCRSVYINVLCCHHFSKA